MKKAIVVGASSGIGYQLAVLLAQNGYKVGVTGRRDQLLLNLQATNPEEYMESFCAIGDFWALNIFDQPFWHLVRSGGASRDILLGWGAAAMVFVVVSQLESRWPYVSAAARRSRPIPVPG